MLGSLIRVRSFMRNVRGFRTNCRLRDAKPESSTPKSKPQEASDNKTEVMQNCMSKARIRLANYMMLATVLVCLMIIIMGNKKKSHKMEEMKIQHDDFRRQITTEFRESAKHDKK